jgi:hypothetical protein
MFAPHTAQVAIARTEPVGISPELATEIVRKRNAALAFSAIMRDALKVNRSQGQQRTERLLRRWEMDGRMGPLRPFIESWNYWREFYTKEEIETTWVPKTNGALTTIETIIDLCKENQIDPDLFVACGHRAYARSRYPLSLSMLCANGLDYFNRHAEQILVEIDEAEYQRKAADEWRPDED